MKRLEWSLCVLGLFYVMTQGFSQNDLPKSRVSIIIHNQPLSQALAILQQQTKIPFYYSTNEGLNVSVSIEADQNDLDSALTALLHNTDLGYINYRNYAIIIGPKIIIGNTYTTEYYQALQQGISNSQISSPEVRVKIIGDIKKIKSNAIAKITGTILQQKDRSPIIGATVKVLNTNKGTATDEKGRYSMDLPSGKYQLQIEYIGNTDINQEIQVYSDGTLNFNMDVESTILDEIVIGARSRDANVQNVQIGVTQLDVKAINKLPSFLGESDVIKALLLSPGVSTIGEGATGFNVRGGDVDQNLMLQDDGLLFNSSHALGFFSTFHSDLIRNVTLYKSIIPAQYGGRLASVLDVELKDGSFEKYKIKAGIGPVSSRIAVDGPIFKNKTSFIVGFRSSYSDWVLRQAKNFEVKNSTAFFYDANLRLTHKFSDKSSLMVALYNSKDEFGYNNSFGFDYRTENYQAILKNIISKKFYSKLSITKGRYSSVQSDFDGIDAAQLDNDINFINVKEQVTYDPKQGIQFIAGLSSVFYNTLPGKRNALGSISSIFSKELDKQKGLESAGFINGDFTVTPQLQVSAGLRISTYQFLGPGNVFTYTNSNQRKVNEIVDTVKYNNGKVIASYFNPEPRLSARFKFTTHSSIKLGYSRTVQYLNQIFNSDSPTPTSQYQLSTNYIKPNKSHNLSFGFFKNYFDNSWETSLEVYGRKIDQLFDYKDFAVLTVNDHLETEMLQGIGKAYGAELSIKKHKGLLHGVFGYTYSRTLRKVEGINEGKWYPNNFDKPHDLHLVMNYQYNQRHTLTMNFTYSTGRPTTAPQGGYRLFNGVPVPIYSARNALRIPDYHRLDLAYTMGKGYRADKKLKTSWTISLYNVYARKNAFSVFFTQSPFTAAQANKLAILGTIFPSLTFNIETQ